MNGRELPSLEKLAQPAWNRADSLARAFDSVILASDLRTAESAHHELLYAIGNDHAGTYYPVVLAVVPVIEQILTAGTPWSQFVVLEALIDLTAAFEPEPGYELFRGEPLDKLLQQQIVALKALVAEIQKSRGAAGQSARELLRTLEQP